MISEHDDSFAGLPVVEWEPDSTLDQARTSAYKITLSYDRADSGEHWTDRFGVFLDQPDVEHVTTLIVGAWEDPYEAGGSEAIVEALVAARERLPNLRALFLGDMIGEECEISWIVQTDVSPLFDAYPQLEHFAVRGATGLQFGPLRHQHLRALVIESGGLDAQIVRVVAAADLPTLEHLELWLGTDNYGGNTTVDDLAPILSGERFPKLRYLGLRDSDIADGIAEAVARAPILERARVLDLSLGTLGDRGAQALLDSPLVAKLEKLDIHHHYCSDEMITRLEGLPIEVDASEQEQADEDDDESYRYVAVGE